MKFIPSITSKKCHSCQCRQFLKRMKLGRILKKDEPNAVNLYKLAATDGHSDSQYALAICYMDGHVVKKDKAKAVKWFRLAAEQGHCDAQKQLGDCYMNGEGVKKDDTEAAKWFRKAAEQGK